MSVSFYEMQGIRNAYRDACAKMGVAMEKPLLLRFTELEVVMLAPIVPHFADNVWRTLLHKTESIWKGTWPVVKPVRHHYLSLRMLLVWHFSHRGDPQFAVPKLVPFNFRP